MASRRQHGGAVRSSGYNASETDALIALADKIITKKTDVHSAKQEFDEFDHSKTDSRRRSHGRIIVWRLAFPSDPLLSLGRVPEHGQLLGTLHCR
jgi:hypothetical protein